MSHEMSDVDRFGYVGEPAWHRLGIQMPGGMSAVESLTYVRANKPVELCEIFGRRLTSEGWEVFEIPNHRVQIRPHLLDAGNDKGIYGIVSSGYQQVQDTTLAQIADTCVGIHGSLEVETIGTVKHGQRVFILMKIMEYEAIGGDPIWSYICLSQGHGGLEALRMDPTNVRVVCENTYQMMVAGSHFGISLRHQGDMDTKIEEAKVALRQVLAGVEKAKEQDKALARTSLRPTQVSGYFNDVYTAVFGEVDRTDDESIEKFKKTMTEWIERLAAPNQMMPGVSGTAWAAVNAITEWSDHYRGRGSARRRTMTENRVSSNLFGASHRTKSLAYAHALALV